MTPAKTSIHGLLAEFDTPEALVSAAMLNPNAKVAAGYKPVMTHYTGRITDDEIRQIIAYIRSLK